MVLVGPLADSNAVYYYHYDALGSVVALSDAGGDTVQTYEYSVYGQVAAEDPNHPNPYLFTGRRFDAEIGLYYYRARYYDPFTGRFLQTDPIGYGDGLNCYAYCGNNPLAYIDPSGLTMWGVDIYREGGYLYLQFDWFDLSDLSENDLEDFRGCYDFVVDCNEDERFLLEVALQDIFELETGKDLLSEVVGGVKIVLVSEPNWFGGAYSYIDQRIRWNVAGNPDGSPPYMNLAHEMIHAYLHRNDILVPESFVVDPDRIMDPDYWAWEAKCEARVNGIYITLIYPNGEVKAFDYRCARFTMNQLRLEAGFLPPIKNEIVKLWEEE